METSTTNEPKEGTTMTTLNYYIRQNPGNSLWYAYHGGGILPTRATTGGTMTAEEQAVTLRKYFANGFLPTGDIEIR